MLEVDITCALGAVRLEAAFAAAGGVTALFGRSGAGKTSVINAIAGLVRPVRGRIAVGGTVLFDHARRIDLPRHRRRIGYVFQEPRLLPHLSVRQNLLYGRWFTPSGERRGSLCEVVELLGIGDLLRRRPGTLSGGERQRVAIGRALLASPRLLLMDEPLASLDAARKEEILPFLLRLRGEARLPIVYVTHSLDEVSRLADTMVVLAEGKVAAQGPVAEVMARLDLGLALGHAEAGAVLSATVAGHDLAYALTELLVAGQRLTVPRLEAPVGSAVRLRVRARDVALATVRPTGTSVRNLLRAHVRSIACAEGPYAELVLDLGGAPLRSRLTRRSVDELGLAPGTPVIAMLRAVAVERRQLGPFDGQG